MFVVLTRRQIRTVFILILLILFAVYLFIKGWDGLFIHARIPDDPAGNLALWDPESVPGPFLPAEDGYSVMVDLDYMQLTLYENGQVTHSWPVSGGSKNYPSPTGNWRVSDIAHWGDGVGCSWIGLDVPWGRYGIHGTAEPWASECTSNTIMPRSGPFGMAIGAATCSSSK